MSLCESFVSHDDWGPENSWNQRTFWKFKRPNRDRFCGFYTKSFTAIRTQSGSSVSDFQLFTQFMFHFRRLFALKASELF
jgi:hypothetical protein